MPIIKQSRGIIFLLAFIFFIAGLFVSLVFRQNPIKQMSSLANLEADADTFNLWSGVLYDDNDRRLTLSSLMVGYDYMLVNFWATWCPPCRREIPLLEKISLQNSRVKVVGISYEDRQIIADFINEMPIKYDILRTSADIFSFLRGNGNYSASLPYTLLLNAEGKVINQKLGDFRDIGEIQEFVEKI